MIIIYNQYLTKSQDYMNLLQETCLVNMTDALSFLCLTIHHVLQCE